MNVVPRGLFIASLVSNALLVVVCGLGWQHLNTKSQMQVEEKMQQAEVVVPKEKPSAPFHWSQLEAPDFAAYAENLRSVGCPEVTIADIIRAELAEIYDSRRITAQQEFSTNPAGGAPLETLLQGISREETAAFAAIMNPTVANDESNAPEQVQPKTDTPAAATVAALSPQTADNPDATPPPLTTLTPVAFQVGNDAVPANGAGDLSVTPSAANIEPTAVKVVANLRQEFAEQVAATGGTDTSSSAYHQSWRTAQARSDEAFSSLFGGDAYVRMQIKAVQQQYLARQQAQSQASR